MYILVEQILNGTVTMGITIRLVDTPDFPAAIERIKSVLADNKNLQSEEINIDYRHDPDNETFGYFITGQTFDVYGEIKNEEPLIL